MSRRQPQYGITPPICVNKPKNEEMNMTIELQKHLKPFQVFDTDEGLQNRIRVLTKLNDLVKTFVEKVLELKNLPTSIDGVKITGKIYTFGSYRLGVHTQGADIDTLCVVPTGVERNDFFTTFSRMLKETEGVEDVRQIENAFVPVIKLYFERIEIDILFAQLQLNTIKDDQVSFIRKLARAGSRL